MISLRTTTRARNLTVLAALLLSTALIQPSFADGGRGGDNLPTSVDGFGGTGTNPDGVDGHAYITYYLGGGGGGAMNLTDGLGGSGGNGGVTAGYMGAAAQGGAGGTLGVEFNSSISTSFIFLETSAADGTNGGDGANGTTSSTGAGGGGGGGAGALVQLLNNGTVLNHGTMTGGAGGDGGVGGGVNGERSGGGGGEGGAGVLMRYESTLNNTGTVTGGNGGNGGRSGSNWSSFNGEGGDGGHGVLFLNGGIVVNSGTITGGDAGLGGGVGGSGPHGSAGSAIYGAGLTVTNSGTLSGGLEADGTYGNAITFTGGTNALELRAGSTIIGNVDSLAGSDDVFALGGSTNGTFDISTIGASAQYRGFEEFEKRGSSNWTLTGDTASTDFWLIDEGGLYVNGDTSLNMVVDTNGTLGGSGSIGNASISGTLAPGNSIGTLTINGDLIFNSGSTYYVEASPTDADLVIVNGMADLTGGTVVVTYDPGTYVTNSYLILSASDGLGGTTFSGLNAASFPGLVSSLAYDANNVYLQTVVDTANNPLFQALATNQQSVANSLLSYFDTTASLPAEFLLLAETDLSKLSGEVATTASFSALTTASQLLDAAVRQTLMDEQQRNLSQRFGNSEFGYSAAPAQPSSVKVLAALGGETHSAANEANRLLAMSGNHSANALTGYTASPWSIWGTVYGGAQEIDGSASIGSANLTTRNWGVASGFERQIEGGKIGLALGGAGSNFDLANDLGSGRTATFNAGLYGVRRFANAYVSAVAAYGFNNVDTSRSVFGDTLNADYDAHMLSGRIESGYRFETRQVAVTPYAAVQGASYFLPDYSETSANGGPFALDYESQTQSSLRTELGARISHVVATERGDIKLGGGLAWVWNAHNANDVTASFQSLAAPSFTIDGATPDRHAVLVDASAEFGLTQNLAAKLSFNGEFSGNVTAYGGAAKLHYSW